MCTISRQERRNRIIHSNRLRALLPFFFNDPPITAIYTLSLHDALPIYTVLTLLASRIDGLPPAEKRVLQEAASRRSEEHTSELQSRLHLVCRLLLERKKLMGLSI